MYTMYGKGIPRVEVLAKPGTTYVRATLDSCDPVLELVDTETAAYETKNLKEITQ